MITDIGIVAGEIWHQLDQKGEMLLSELVSKIGRERDVVLMSVGWLAREGHVVLERHNEGLEYAIRLRNK